ncbi:hypothetical protein GCM10022226_02190 [Sphaerisporangium flaviroseum]|uniref:Uncharacterized protein n=1 Tax=Sphaerisporangium flaviroseum TaxID=509199 RepID=A0ABP7H7V5_9ACTN
MPLLSSMPYAAMGTGSVRSEAADAGPTGTAAVALRAIATATAADARNRGKRKRGIEPPYRGPPSHVMIHVNADEPVWRSAEFEVTDGCLALYAARELTPYLCRSTSTRLHDRPTAPQAAALRETLAAARN